MATGLGQPSSTKYDWSLEPKTVGSSHRILPDPLASRLRIENFCDRATQSLYDGTFRLTGTGDVNEKFGRFNLLNQELHQLELDFISAASPRKSPIHTYLQLISLTWIAYVMLYLRIAQIHLRLYAFFDLRSIPPILSLYQSCYNFLEQILLPGVFGSDFLNYVPYYIFQLILASGFTLLNLLRSSFSQYVDVEAGKLLFNSTISACRKISISNNDLPGRLAEVLAQLWAWGNKSERAESQGGGLEQEIKLVVRSRMSMSIVYDSLWKWRKGFKKDSERHLTRKIPSHLVYSRGD